MEEEGTVDTHMDDYLAGFQRHTKESLIKFKASGRHFTQAFKIHLKDMTMRR